MGLPGMKKKSKKPDPHTYTSNADRPWDAQFDDDVPEWGRSYGSGANNSNSGAGGKKGRVTETSDDTYGYSNGTQGTQGNKRDSSRVGGGRAERDEDWDHQF